MVTLSIKISHGKKKLPELSHAVNSLKQVIGGLGNPWKAGWFSNVCLALLKATINISAARATDVGDSQKGTLPQIRQFHVSTSALPRESFGFSLS